MDIIIRDMLRREIAGHIWALRSLWRRSGINLEAMPPYGRQMVIQSRNAVVRRRALRIVVDRGIMGNDQ